MVRMSPVGAGLSAILIFTAGCGSEDASDGQSVSRDFIGEDDWPLTVNSGEIRCQPSPGGPAITFIVDGKTYALNGTAKTHTDAADIDPIWAESPELGNGLKKDISPLIDFGLVKCE